MSSLRTRTAELHFCGSTSECDARSCGSLKLMQFASTHHFFTHTRDILTTTNQLSLAAAARLQMLYRPRADVPRTESFARQCDSVPADAGPGRTHVRFAAVVHMASWSTCNALALSAHPSLLQITPTAHAAPSFSAHTLRKAAAPPRPSSRSHATGSSMFTWRSSQRVLRLRLFSHRSAERRQ